MKKALVIFLVLFFNLFNQTLLAAAPKAYINSSGQLSVNDKLYGASFWTARFTGKDILVDNFEAQKHFDKYQSQAQTGSLLMWGGLAGALTYAFASDKFNSGIYIAIVASGLIPSAFFQASARKHFFKAINIYNGVAPEMAASPSIEIKLSPIFFVNNEKETAPGFGMSVDF